MSTFLPEHTKRLSKLVNKPGGVTAAEAVAAAERNVSTLHDRGLAEVSALVEQMTVAGALLRADRPGEVASDLYKLGNQLLGIAGVFGMGELGEVAFSLCALLDRVGAAPVTPAGMAAIQLHLKSLRLIRTGGLDATQIQAIGAALRQVADRVMPG